MVKIKKICLLSLILALNGTCLGVPNWVTSTATRKALQAVVQAATAVGFCAQNPFGNPRVMASVQAAEDLNKNTFTSLNKHIPILLVIGSSYALSVASQELDFKVLEPKANFATGLSLSLFYLLSEQFNTWLKEFGKGKLSWQKGIEVKEESEEEESDNEEIIGDDNV